MSSHSAIGASGAKRWMACPASIALSQDLPEAPSSAYAEEGTLAHELAENMLRNFYSIGDNGITSTPLSFEPKHEMSQHVLKYCDAITDLTTSLEGNFQVLIEEHVHISWIHEDLWGTVDCIVYDEVNNHMHVFDLKYGEGIMVDAEENPQLLFYATGAFLRFMPETITSYIIQPRANSGDTVKSWTYPASRIHQFETELHTALADVEAYKYFDAKDPMAYTDEELQANKSRITSSDVYPGDHCQFCPAKAICPKHLETFTDLSAASVRTPADLLGDEFLLKVVTHKKELLSWIDEVVDVAQQKLLKGEKIEGLKLILGTKHRAWKDPEKTMKKFGKRKITKSVILTPKQAEGIFDKKDLASHIEQPKGQPKLALESAKGKAIVAPALEAHEDLTKKEGEE